MRVPVIIGPTAGGKTGLAVEVALRTGGEVVSCDAFQIYLGMDIGSAKPTLEERRGVPHHGLDLVDPRETFTVHEWLTFANRTVEEIRARDAQPILAGGTHLYVKAFMDGLFEGPAPDPEIRARLQSMEASARRSRLESVDPEAASRIHPNDERRTIRALEVYEQTGTPISDLQRQWDRSTRDDAMLVILDWETDAINRRINARVKAMFDEGLVEEARGLDLGPQAREALGYKQLTPYFEGSCDLESASERIKIETRRFAKNQRTWLRRFRSSPGALVIDATRTPPDEWAQRVISHGLALDQA